MLTEFVDGLAQVRNISAVQLQSWTKWEPGYVKKFDFKKRKPLKVLVSAILLLVIIASDPKVMFFLVTLSFVLSGPITTLYRFYRKRPLTKTLEIQQHSEGKSQDSTINR